MWWVVADLSRTFEFDRQVSCATVISASGHILRKVVADMETWDCGGIGTLCLTGKSSVVSECGHILWKVVNDMGTNTDIKSLGYYYFAAV